MEVCGRRTDREPSLNSSRVFQKCAHSIGSHDTHILHSSAKIATVQPQDLLVSTVSCKIRLGRYLHLYSRPRDPLTESNHEPVQAPAALPPCQIVSIVKPICGEAPPVCQYASDTGATLAIMAVAVLIAHGALSWYGCFANASTCLYTRSSLSCSREGVVLTACVRCVRVARVVCLVQQSSGMGFSMNLPIVE